MSQQQPADNQPQTPEVPKATIGAPLALHDRSKECAWPAVRAIMVSRLHAIVDDFTEARKRDDYINATGIPGDESSPELMESIQRSKAQIEEDVDRCGLREVLALLEGKYHVRCEALVEQFNNGYWEMERQCGRCDWNPDAKGRQRRPTGTASREEDSVPF